MLEWQGHTLLNGSCQATESVSQIMSKLYTPLPFDSWFPHHRLHDFYAWRIFPSRQILVDLTPLPSPWVRNRARWKGCRLILPGRLCSKSRRLARQGNLHQQRASWTWRDTSMGTFRRRLIL